MYILWQEIRSHRCHCFNRTSTGRHYKERVFSLFSLLFIFLFFLTSGHKLSRYFCSFNLALGSQCDNYVATNSIIFYTVAFFIKSKKERSQKVHHDYVIDSKLSLLSENNYVQCVKFKRFKA